MEVKPFYSGRAYYDVTTNTGEKYVFVPQEFVQKGFVQGGQQFYSPGFLTPGAMDSAQAFVLPDDSAVTGAAKSIYKEPTKGFVWKADDFNKLNYDDFSFIAYEPTNTYGTIKGLTIKDGVPYYAQEPSPGANYTLLGKDGVSTNTHITVTRSGGGGGGFFGALMRGDVGGALSMLDPTTAISRELTNLYQPVEKTISKELAQLDKDLNLSKNAPALAAIALSVAAPGVGSAIGQQMIAAGLIPAATSAAVATAIGTGVANAALQVAQGKSAEDALKGAVVGGVAGFAGGQVGDYLVGDPGAVKNFVSSTAANMVAGKDPETAAKTALVQTGIQGTADLISTAQAEKYLEKLPIPDYLNVTTPPTSADVIAAFPETNPNLVEVSQPNLTSNEIDAALSNLTGGYTLGGTKEGITATMPITKVTGTEPIDYTLNTITGGEGLTLPTSPNLESMGGGQGLTTAVTGGVLSEAGLTPTGNVTLGDATSFINTGAPVTTNKTYTYDDGSTITVDKDGNIIGYTDATNTAYTGAVETPSSPLTKSQVEGLIKLGLGIYGTSQVANVVRDAISSGDADTTTQTGFPFTPSDISGWARPEYTQTFQGPIDLNSLFTTDNLLGGTQWAGLQGNQFANIPQVSMSDFISSIQNGKV